MHKKGWRVAAGIAILLVGMLNVTRPTEDDYQEWLAAKYGIICQNDGVDARCQQLIDGQPRMIAWQSRWVRDTGFYVQIDDQYQNEQGDTITLKPRGIMKQFVAW